MITKYHRPETLEATLELLGRDHVDTRPLAGGTALNQPTRDEYEVVDLQYLGLDKTLLRGNTLEAGATVTLQRLLDTQETPPVLRRCLRLEATYHLRQMATLAGTLVAADARSPVAAALLAMDASLVVLPGSGSLPLGEMLLKRPEVLRGRLITRVDLPVNIGLAYHAVSRTPADWPLVSAAIAVWPSGRTRVVLGGYGSAPIMAMDGPEPGGVEAAVESAFASAGDQWASVSYRQETAKILAQRGLAELQVSAG
jgi:CO/xanthine dehydrogenase FAD-binding subunit